MRGVILTIERCSTHDGPGIRTVVFMKGCPLRCLWCSTPESQHVSPEIGYFSNRCIQCGRCAEVCPNQAIHISSNGGLSTNRTKCNRCGNCVKVCYAGARKIFGEDTRVEEVLDEIKKDKVFYKHSDGGITLSGGEPLMQPGFSLGLLQRCREEGIHTAIETCSYGRWDVLQQILRYTDMAYMDIKHMNSAVHKKLTERSNKIILSNILQSSRQFPDLRLILRVPVIPGFNDFEENIISTAQFSSQLNGGVKIELLPYHRLGIARYRALERNYSLEELVPPSINRLQYLKELVGSHGIDVKIDTYS